MDDIELLVREARPESGHRDRALTSRAERELAALVGPDPALPIPQDDAERAGDTGLEVFERDALTGSGRPAAHAFARVRRPGSGRQGRRTLRRRRTVVTSVTFGAVVVIAALGIGAPLLSAPDAPRSVAAPAVPEASTILVAAAEQLVAQHGQAESTQARGDGPESSGETVHDAAPAVPQSVSDAASLVNWLTSSAATAIAQAELLESLATDGRASSAERSTDPAGDALWRIGVGEISLVIRAETGAIVAVVGVDGVEREIPPIG